MPDIVLSISHESLQHIYEVRNSITLSVHLSVPSQDLLDSALSCCADHFLIYGGFQHRAAQVTSGECVQPKWAGQSANILTAPECPNQ